LKPTHSRYWVVVFAITLAIVLYIDRVCIAEAAPAIAKDLKISKGQLGWVFGAFTLAYALFELPSGYLGDAFGPRRVLIRIVIWWSFFTIATGWAWNFLSLTSARFLFGAGEAGCFPNLTRALNTWLPAKERNRAQALLWMSARWGGAATPYLVLLVLGLVNWRVAFLLFGALGILWALIFYSWYRDDPRGHRSVNAAEMALLPLASDDPSASIKVLWSSLVRSKSIWLLCGQYFASTYYFYFFITWFPTYLLEVHHFDIKKSALLAGLPLFVGGLGSIFSGWITPHVQRLFRSVSVTRRFIGVVGAGATATCLIAATSLRDPVLVVGAITVASLFSDMTLPLAWTTCMDVGGKHVGTVSATMNMMGNIGGFVSPVVVGYIVGITKCWDLTFYVMAGLYLIGAICWWLLDPVTSFENRLRD
jgi:ACS family glucarate transporter-like MFS transporter